MTEIELAHAALNRAAAWREKDGYTIANHWIAVAQVHATLALVDASERSTPTTTDASQRKNHA